MTGLPFIKMHGLSNDFVVIDGRATAVSLDPAWVRGVADRRTGVGCDQLKALLDDGDEDVDRDGNPD